MNLGAKALALASGLDAALKGCSSTCSKSRTHSEARDIQARSSMVFRSAAIRNGAIQRMLFRTRESGRQKIEKRTYVWRSLL